MKASSSPPSPLRQIGLIPGQVGTQPPEAPEVPAPGDPAPGQLSQSRRGQAVGAGRTGPKPRALKAESGATGPEPPESAILEELSAYAQLWLPQVSTVVYGQGASGTGIRGGAAIEAHGQGVCETPRNERVCPELVRLCRRCREPCHS